jgi:cyclophilin family peptidyl-prolyl cis-trans isomerase
MPGKKLTARKRAELKQKKQKQMQRGNFSALLIFFVIIIVVIAGGYFVITNLGSNENGQITNGKTTNSAPVATEDYLVVPKNANIFRIEPLENDYDLDNDEINITNITSPEIGSAEVIVGKGIVYTPVINFSGEVKFEYTITDGIEESTSTINLILPVNNNPIALIDTSEGTIAVELYLDKVPNTVSNFVELANSEFYKNLVFHRVIDDFMIQGGGFRLDGTKKESPFGPIDLEIHPDVRHVDGAIAMARTSDPNSATSQFYICDGAQDFLDDDYAAFGVVLYGIDVVRTIASVETTSKNGMNDWPVDDVMINDITVGNLFTLP